MASEEIVVGPGYLDALETIPEDGSVAAANIQHAVPQSVTNLSTVSAVASSDSDGGFEVVEQDPSKAAKATSAKSKRRGKRPRQSGGATRTSSGTGAAIGGDAFSDTHASLGGAADQPEQKAPSTEALKQDYSATSCTKRKLTYALIVAVILIGIAVGIYLIVTHLSSSNSISADFAESQPTQDPVFPPYYLESESFFPSVSPTFNQEDIDELDEALTRTIGVDTASLYDTTSPEGKCRYWLTHGDQQQLRVSEDGEDRVQQRFVLCLLYHYTNGESWTIDTWLDGTKTECDWEGVTCNATDVAGIELENRNLTGSLPEALGTLSQLHLLCFLDNSISGSIPSTIFDRLKKLMWLDLSNNQFTGTIPTGEENIPINLTVMYLKGNLLQGNLPFFPNLERVLAQRNRLTSMDEEYATEGTSLMYLYAYNNQLSGQLPSTWNTPNLQILDVGFNNLNGPIPQALWDLPALESLVVDNNSMTGNLPESSSNEVLSTVWLDVNQLVGTIPSNFGTNWKSLTSLKLQENSLTGVISEDHCKNWPMSEATLTEWELESDCNTNTIQCSCCTQCYPEMRTRYLRR